MYKDNNKRHRNQAAFHCKQERRKFKNFVIVVYDWDVRLRRVFRGGVVGKKNVSLFFIKSNTENVF